MITITINGEERAIGDKSTVRGLLDELKLNNKYCAVERNLKLVPREEHDDCQLQDGDRIEIVTLVGGG